MSDMHETPGQPSGETAPDPGLRFLRILVTVLAGTMIAGLITIITLLVIRFPAAPAPRPELPEDLVLPDGLLPEAVTFGRDWLAVVTDSDEILIFSRDGKTLRQRIRLAPPE